MNVAVFGATGKTGSLIVKGLLAHSHHVTVLVRSPERLTPQSPLLKIVQGDVTDLAAVQRAVAGNEAVISAIGMASLKASTLMRVGLGNIANAMQQMGVRRVISVGTAGIFGELGGLPGLIVGLILGQVIKDHRAAYDVLAASTLDWTVLRPVSLTDAPSTGTYRTAEHGVPARGQKISRADVAQFIIQALEKGLYIRQSPALAD